MDNTREANFLQQNIYCAKNKISLTAGQVYNIVIDTSEYTGTKIYLDKSIYITSNAPANIEFRTGINYTGGVNVDTFNTDLCCGIPNEIKVLKNVTMVNNGTYIFCIPLFGEKCISNNISPSFMRLEKQKYVIQITNGGNAAEIGYEITWCEE